MRGLRKTAVLIVNPVSGKGLALKTDFLMSVALGGRRTRDLARYAWVAYRGCLSLLKDVPLYQGKTIRLESDSPFLFQIDGDPGVTLPVIIGVLPQAVSFCAPG